MGLPVPMAVAVVRPGRTPSGEALLETGRPAGQRLRARWSGRPEFRAIPRLAYVDTDPVFTQVKLARGQADFRKLVDTHDVHFTYGERDPRVPDTGHRWLKTRTPVVLSRVAYRPAATATSSPR